MSAPTSEGASQSRRAGVSAIWRGPAVLLANAGAAGAWAARGPPTPLSDTASGLLALALMGMATLYAVRRRNIRLSLFLLRPFHRFAFLRPFAPLAVQLDKAQSWRLFHFAFGVAWALALWWHVNAAQGGWVETALLTMCGLILASGILGAFIQWALPLTMLRGIEREVRFDDVEARRRSIFVDAEERVLGASDDLIDVYVAQVRPVLQGETSRLRLAEATVRGIDPGALLRGRLWRHLEHLDENDAQVFHALIDLAEQKGRLDLNLFHLELSTSWLIAHDALVAGSVVLVGLHLLALSYF